MSGVRVPHRGPLSLGGNMVLLGMGLFVLLTYFSYVYMEVMFKLLISVLVASCIVSLVHSFYVGVKTIYGFKYSEKMSQGWNSLFKRKRKSNVSPTES
jgi:hypothetical protein